jgi:hypothetical protein
VVGPIVVLLYARILYSWNSFVSVRAFSAACDASCAITKIDSAGGKRVDLSRFVSGSEILEYIGSELVGKDNELCRSR